MHWIVWPEQQSPATPTLLGGKGAALGVLARHGLPVPSTCCLTTEAYHHWLQEGKPDTLPVSIHDALHPALAQLTEQSGGIDHYAVRSSAVGEDASTSSFAGQFRTVLNVPREHVAAAIIAVWRSTDADTVTAYRDQVQAAPGAMAVVIQPMLTATTAGVVFTAEPLSNNPEHIVVNAVWGLGEGLVSGLTTPDHWVVDRASGHVLEQHRATQDRRVTVAPIEGTVVEPTAPDQATRPPLTLIQLADVVHLALQAETHFTGPQDIEWAYADDRFWLLQARPITTQANTGWLSEFDSETDADTVWTAANIQEVLPGVVTPLTWSLLHEQLNHALRTNFLETRTLLDPTTDFLALFYNRAFLNVSALRQVAARSPGTSPEAIDEQYLGRARDPHQPRQPLSLRHMLTYGTVLPLILRLIWRTPRRVRQISLRVWDWRTQSRHWEEHSDTKELMDHLHATQALAREVGVLHIATTSGASTSFETAHRLALQWCGDDAHDLVAQLTMGIQRVASAEAGKAYIPLAAAAAQDHELREAIMHDDAWERVQQLSSPAAVDFRRRLDAFMAVYGHRCVREFELAAPAWEEDPQSVLALLRNMLDDPEAHIMRAATQPQAQRAVALRTIRQRLTLLRYGVFQRLLRQAQMYVKLREQTKTLWMVMHHCVRRLMRHVGRHLQVQGILDDPHDLYFLTFAEVERLVAGIAETQDTTALVRRRRAAYARNEHVHLPESFHGRPQPLWNNVPVSTGPTLQGIPVAPGVVTGPARVIHDPRRDTTLHPGEILVAPITDAAWSPLFIVAAGLVVDVGGPLSHGAIVAREYGLPTVVNVKEGTRRIHTGQTLTVNGSTGEVVLHEEGYIAWKRH